MKPKKKSKKLRRVDVTPKVNLPLIAEGVLLELKNVALDVRKVNVLVKKAFTKV
jgi:hypothetical protein